MTEHVPLKNSRCALLSTKHHIIWTLFKTCLQKKQIQIAFVFSLLVLTLGIVVDIFTPLLFKQIVDKLYNDDINMIILFMLAYGCIWLISQANIHVKEFFSSRLELHFTATVQQHTLKAILGLSFSTAQAQKMGELMSMVERTKYAIPNILIGLFFYIIPTILSVSIIALFIASAYPLSYMLLLLVTLVAFLVYNLSFGRVQSAQAEKSVAADTALTTTITDTLMAADTIKVFAVEEAAMDTVRDELQRNEDICCKVRQRLAAIRIGQVAVLGTGMTSLSLVIILSVINHQTSPGSFVLFTGYLLQFINPVNAIGYILKDLKKAFVEVRISLSFIHDHLMNNQKMSNNTLLSTISAIPQITVDNVTFSHIQSTTSLLQKVNFTIQPGEKIIIAGESGVGKSTLAKILCNLYHPTSGKITVDGQDTKYLSRKTLSTIIAYHPQDIQLINGSLIDNLQLTAPMATEQAMMSAIQSANLDRFIKNRLNHDLSTPLGDQGVALSGGEKQRIGIARTLLTKAPICIFDEPFSSLDVDTANTIFNNIMQLFSDKTVIFVSHQLLDGMQSLRRIPLNHPQQPAQ